MIQSGINQLISQAAIFGRLSPGVEERHELYANKKKLAAEEKQLKRQKEELKKETGLPEDNMKLKNNSIEDTLKAIAEYEKAAVTLGLPEKQIEVSKKGAELGTIPQTTAAKQIELAKYSEKIGKTLSEKNNVFRPYSVEQIRAERAKTRAAEKGAQQVKQRRNFMDYLSSMETSLGGKVGDLPLQMQKQIAKDYSKSEREKIMNAQDKEKKGK